MKIRPYTLWEPLPADHSSAEEHPEKGLGKLAYQNWKRKNLSLKDQSRGQLGPLTNALTADMLVSIGNALIDEEGLRPKRNMTDDELSAWIRSDPKYEWVKTVSDADLIRFLDKHFSVLDSETFLSMRILGPPEVPHTIGDDVNYCAGVHSAFADRWLNRLTELRAGGWDDSVSDLRQAYINALENQPTLQNEARTYRTSSHDRLISHLRAWTQQKAAEQAAHKQRRDKVKASAAPTPSAQSSPSQTKPTGTQLVKDGALAREVKALRTEIAQLKSQTPANQAPNSQANQPASMFCNGCGRSYTNENGRVMPCLNKCVYSEHPEHNARYQQGQPWPPNKPPLTWGTVQGYLEKYGKEMPQIGKNYLERRAKNARKRERERQEKDSERKSAKGL
jgi:hypothetical protein